MASPFTRNPLIAGIEEIRRSWGWILTFGILLMLFGVVCIVGDVTATFATVLAFGWLLLLSGVVALIHAFRARTWSGFLLSLLSAQMPASSVWFIGFAIGVDMIVDGTSLVGFATAIHSLPGLPVYRAA